MKNVADGAFLESRFTKEDYEEVARKNFHSFDDMKNTLVLKRESLCSMDDMAKELGCTVDDVAEFEQYYADPTLSDVQRYALLVNSFVDIQVRDHKDEGSSLDRLMECERIVDEKIADGDFDGIMKVVDEDGSFPVVAILSDESVSMLEEQVNAIGGRANVFISGEDGEISYMAVDGTVPRKGPVGE